MMNEHRKIQVDRMVDGELSLKQQRELLLSCENDQSWRELALAYVESQAWGSELNLLMEETTTNQSKVGVGRNREVRTYSDGRPLFLAAAILLLLGIGFGIGWVLQDATPTSPATEIVAETGDSSADRADDRLSSMQLTVSDPATNELRQIDLPIVRASDLGPNWLQQFGPSLPDGLLQKIRGSGLDIKRTRTFTPFDLGDGRRVVIPIDFYIEQDYQ